MRQGTFLFIALAVSWLSLSPAGAASRAPDRAGRLPPLMLWAWERPVDLRSLRNDVGIAFLAQTITVRRGELAIAPRRNPLRVGETTPLVAVTRIESDAVGAAALSDLRIAELAAAIAGTTSLPRVVGVQVDFDAAESERDVYRRLIHAVRARVGDAVPLSITALASWCAADRWIAGLPVDEAVPMLFRMGPFNQPYAGIAAAPASAAPECRTALGTALDEPLYTRARGRRVYVFNPGAWTPATVARAQEMLE